MNKTISRLLSSLQEVALLVLVAALFLPWFRDPGQAPLGYANEVLSGFHGIPLITYALILLAYGLSRFTGRKLTATIPLAIANFLVLLIAIGLLLDGNVAGRTGPTQEGGLQLLNGFYLNWLAIFILAAAIVVTETGRSRTPLFLTTITLLSPVPYLILFILNPAVACVASFPHLFILGYAIKRWYDSWSFVTSTGRVNEWRG